MHYTLYAYYFSKDFLENLLNDCVLNQKVKEYSFIVIQCLINSASKIFKKLSDCLKNKLFDA